MGVTGLWRLIEPAGKPVPVETLENKVLAVDISIWLHQMVKGYQDAKGAPLANAHLIGLFQRLCKLLYFRIKPVFVFDGAFPDLKKETIAKRQDNKLKYNSESERLKRELALLLTKKTAISSLLGKQISPKKSSNNIAAEDDIFKLPALPERQESESESEDEQNSSGSIVDLHTVDVESEHFKKLPVKEKYDLLIELKETRKMNSWGKLHELPKKSDSFSDFQMQRLLKRRKVQEVLEETEKEMGDAGMSLNDLESLLNEEGIDTKIEALPTRRIASNDTTRFLLINNVKQALADAKKRKEEMEASTSKEVEEIKDVNTEVPSAPKKDELEEDLEKAIKMSLEANEADTSACTSQTDDSWTTYVSDTDYSADSADEDGFEPPDMSSAKAYIMQYSDFTDRAIDEIVSKRSKGVKKKGKTPKITEIIQEINKDKSVIVDNVELSSSDEDCIQVSKQADQSTNVESDEIASPDRIMDATQASVICIENQVDEVVALDSSADEIPDQSIITDEIKQPSSNFVNKDESNTANTSKSNIEKESDSSDDDFEDVPEIEEKGKQTVIQLTLNVNDAPEDDIFADVFTAIRDVVNPSDSTELDQVIPKTEEIEDDDDELQMAIKMSMECVTEEENNDLQVNNDQAVMETSKKPNILNLTEKSNETAIAPEKEHTKISKTQESLDAIHTAQSYKPLNNDQSKINKEIIKETTVTKAPISTEQLNDMVDEIQSEEHGLIQEKGRLDRVGRNITEQMTKEAQELLRLFGIPYIVAPMEAEAQCAFLESVKLTDGTITDDSDIWLFGGRTVYKNFFNQKKHVLQFLSERIEKSFNLSREQLVLLALLVGSDYTTGVTGVGPVTALEILASFPFNKKKVFNETSKKTRYMEMIAGLQEFKQWIRSGRRTDNTSLKKKLRNVSLTDDFPSVRVVQAYLEPNIEKSEDKFTWGEIDITILRDYAKEKFGWSQHKLDEIVKPVLKRLVERKSQKTVHDYFKRKVEFQCLEEHMSKRVKAAVQRMGPEVPAEEQTTASEDDKQKPKRKGRKGDGGKAGPSNAKRKKTDDGDVLKQLKVKAISETKEGNKGIDIKIVKTDRFQEIIPQREKDKQCLLQNKLKAIELFRTTNIDKKKKPTKRIPILPKAEAELSESSDSN